jgi:hypothetical protein
MFATLHKDINSLKYSLFHLTRQSNSQNGRAAKIKDGIISETKFLWTISVDRTTFFELLSQFWIWLPYHKRDLCFLS